MVASVPFQQLAAFMCLCVFMSMTMCVCEYVYRGQLLTILFTLGVAAACIPVRNQHCLQEGFNNTSFPNMIGNEGEDEVTNMILLMKALEAATSCYKYLMVFACSAFLPPCSGNQTLGHHLVPPCRSLCQGMCEGELFFHLNASLKKYFVIGFCKSCKSHLTASSSAICSISKNNGSILYLW